MRGWFRISSLYRPAGHVRSYVWLASLVLLFSGLAFAQRDLGTITGRVTDPSGAAVPSATITITEDATGESYKLETTTTGDYTRPALRPGIYTVTAEAEGFRRVTEQNVEVTAGGRVGVPLSMQAGDITESSEVTGQAPLVQNESTQLGAQLNADAVATMPLGAQRTFTYLARLSPGIVPGESSNDASTGGFSANGVRSNGQNNYLLNGVDNNVNVIDFLNGSAYVIGPPPEAIGGVQVVTSGADAEYGRAAGGVINVNLKTGTNQLHGGLWEVLQNNDLNANSWINNGVGQPRPVFKQNQFGAAAGGPIIKNRFFIFGDYQGTRIANVNSSGFGTISTPAEIKGNFSGLLGNSIGAGALGNIAQYEIFDPTTTQTVNGQLVRDPFTGNIIPASRIGPIQAKILNLLPAPNQPVNGFPINDYYYISPGHQDVDSGDLRSDFKLSNKDSLYGSLSWYDNTRTSVPVLPLGLGDSFGGDSQITPTRNAQLGYTRVWTPCIVSETRVAVTRLTTSIFGPGQAVDDYQAYGIGGYDPTPELALNGGLPGISASRYTFLGASNWQPMNMRSNVQDYIQNLAIAKGSHAFKLGAEYRFIQFPFVQVPDPHGTFYFSQNATAYPSTANGSSGLALNTNTGDAMASYLLGVVDTGEISSVNQISSQKETYSVYAQDDWKVTPKLTVNLGVRYELFSPTYERFGRESNFVFNPAAPTLEIPQGADQNAALPPNFATAFPNVTVTRGQVSKYMIPWDKSDFGPRFGLAYKVAPKTVFRLGFGIFYGGEENQGGTPNLGESVPFNETVELARTDLNLNPIGLFASNPFFPNGFAGGLPSNVFSLPAPISFRGIAQDFRIPLVNKWNVAFQRELPWGVALELAYVGNSQIHQTSSVGTNHALNANACPNFGTTNPNITCAALEPIPYIGEGVLTVSSGYGNYNAFTAKAEKRLSNGVEFISSYSWSHALSDACPALTPCAIFDPTNLRSDYANAEWDIRQSFTTGFTYQLPVGKGRQFGAHLNPVPDRMLGGWALNGILTLRGGIPMSLAYNGCQGVWNSCRPDIVAGKNANAAPAGGRSAAEWFDTGAVAYPAPLTGGDAAAFTIRAPGNSTLDAALFKTFRITERWNLEFRFEAFNAFNKTQLGSPDMNLQDSTFGKITSSSGQRNAQFSLRLHF